MQIIRNFHNINEDLKGSVLTIGNFDGVHLGHQEILKNVREIAKKEKLKSALLTFNPHPSKVINPDKYVDINLGSLSQKLRFLKDKNLIDIVFVSYFNQQLKNLSAKDFVQKILVGKLKIKHLVIGYDFIFGKDRLGDANLLKEMAKEYGFSLYQISATNNQFQQIYSSTNIRNFIISGDIKSANLMFGRNYQLDGIVIKGKNLAKEIGFPTANFLPKKDLLKPKFGVYKVVVWIVNKAHKAILNFGVKPTFNGVKPLFEVHIFDFNKNIYGKKITVEFIDFIREEKKFNSIDELKNQIQKDIIVTRN